MVTKKGTEIILDVLSEEGIKVIFGYPGGCVIPLFDEMLNYPKLEFVLVRHEQGATHAADGLARVTGKPQVVIATSGPGATNCVTGLATAMMDSVPMVCITGQVRRAVIGTDAFQETNVIGVTRPITKHNYLIKDIKDLRHTLREAFYLASSGRPGPVVVDIPVDVQRELLEFEPSQEKIRIRGYKNPECVNGQQIAEAWRMISASQRPLLYVGGGINQSFANTELFTFATLTGIPVASTLLGQGVFPEDHRLSLGMLGMHGTYTANLSTTRCDLLITLGARFDDRVTGDVTAFASQAKILHVDIDPSSINKIKQANIGIEANVKHFLEDLNALATPLEIEEWRQELDDLKQKNPVPNFDAVEVDQGALRPEYVLKQLSQITNGQAVIVTDVGQHQMFTCLHYEFKRARSHLSSGGLGTMGYSLPAAMGVCWAEKDNPVISISGDGGFQMNMQELATIREYSIPVKIIILNNTNLGMVKQWQDFFWQKRYASTIFDQNPDFIKLAAAFDIPGYKIEKKEEVAPAIKTMLSTVGPVLLEFKIEKNAHVYPMIPAGQTVGDIITGIEL